jgi:hypothetical protein
MIIIFENIYFLYNPLSNIYQRVTINFPYLATCHLPFLFFAFNFEL